MRVVLDTNVLVAALLFRKRLGEIAVGIDKGLIQPCFSVSTFEEFERVLRYPKFTNTFRRVGLTAEEISETLAIRSVVVPDPRVLPTVVPDIPDNFVLAAAVSAEAACIVSGDKALLQLKSFHAIPIVSPRTFVATIRHIPSR